MENMNGAASFRGKRSGLEEEARHRSPDEITEEDFAWVAEIVDETETPIKKNTSPRPLRFIRGPTWFSNKSLHYDETWRQYLEEISLGLSIGRNSNGLHAAQGNASTSNAAPEGSTSCPDRRNAFQAKHAQSDSDSRRARQQPPRRSRGLKFQCFNELESSIQALQDVTGEFLNALGLLDRMCLLSFENMIMRQRIENTFQAELIRGYLYDNYLQEMARLHALFQQQMYPQPSSSQRRFNNGRNLNPQSANKSLKH
ncbi:uncharacterized protein LOC110025466 [Phalaenopsis equestris]|uniref:uncharacterized protein LOC110025466 n=1 Tax=Phalaenopsis equestris TaxID=78828 RepID=UPI0009E3CCC0|nr:uncharacterized protein LOC110025466 [Phalaenopsis equestris]XP_020581621.1 uncharacterized protein LOC110025466 [Phalaenopsis equestris]